MTIFAMATYTNIVSLKISKPKVVLSVVVLNILTSRPSRSIRS